MNGREMCLVAGQSEVVTVRKPFFRWLGSLHEAILLDEILWRQGVAGEGNEWCATDEEIQEKCCLATRTIARCRTSLVTRGFLKVELRGLPRRAHYVVNVDKIAEDFTQFLTPPTTEVPVLPNGVTGEAIWQNRLGHLAEHTMYAGSLSGITTPPTPNGADTGTDASASSLVEKDSEQLAHAAPQTTNSADTTSGHNPPCARELGKKELLSQIAFDTGFEWGGYKREDGKEYAHIGAIWGQLGKRLDDDPFLALAVWNDFATGCKEYSPSKLTPGGGKAGVVTHLKIWLNGRWGRESLSRARAAA
jgi:hypothetical protein